LAKDQTVTNEFQNKRQERGVEDRGSHQKQGAIIMAGHKTGLLAVIAVEFTRSIMSATYLGYKIASYLSLL
jgi:hypothetical protein